MRHGIIAIFMFVFLLLLLNQTASAQSNAAFHRYERSIEFEHTSITALHQDKKGYIWIGAQGALYRHDGHSFQAFLPSTEDSSALKNGFIWTIVEDCRGDIWIGTRGGGISRYNAAIQGFDNYVLSDRPEGDEMDERVRTIQPDEDCNLWIGTGSGKLIKYDIEADKFRRYEFHNSDTTAVQREIYSLYGAPSEPNALWIGRQDGFYNFNKSTEVFTRVNNLDELADDDGKNNVVYSIIEDNMDRLWLGTNEQGLLFFDRIDGSITQYKKEEESENTLPHNWILSLEEGPGNILWIGTLGGLSKFDPKERHFVNYNNSPGNAKSLSHDIVTSLLVDDSEQLWIGAYVGLNRFNPAREYIAYYSRLNGEANTLTNTEVVSVAEEEDYIWVGVEPDRLIRIVRETNVVERIFEDKVLDRILALLVDREGKTWFGSGGEILHCIDRDGNLVSTDTLRSSIAGVSSSIQTIKESLKEPDILWIGTSASGVYRYDKRTSEVTQFVNHPDDSASLSHNNAVQIFEDDAGNLWIATMGGGINVRLFGSGGFKHVNELLANDLAFPSNNATSFSEDKRGNLWIGTFDQGLVRFNLTSGEMEHFAESTGFPVNYISGVIVDENDVLWLASSRGIIRFDPLQNRASVFGPADGLQGKLFREGAFVEGANGEIYAGGINGLNIFMPQDLNPQTPANPPVITGMLVNDIRLPLDSLWALQGQISFPYYRNFITFEVSMMDYKNPSENQYRFYLDGLDDKTFDSGNVSSIRYSDLSPAKYSLVVQGANSQKEWGPEAQVLSFEIRPAWWNRWWFRFLMIGTAACLAFLGYRFRVNKLLEMERMRFQIARDLHDDLGGELSSIALLADMVHRRAKMEDVDLGRMRKIVNTAQRMVREIRDIIWLIEPTHDNVDDLISKLQNIATQRLAHIDNSFSIDDTLGDVVLDMETRRHYLLCYKEILHNIVKHAQATEVIIKLKDVSPWIVLSIKDNGVGIAPEIMSSTEGNGLRNLGLRAEEMGGIFEILPVEQGTHLVLKIKNPVRT